MVNPVVGGAFSVGSTLLSGMYSRHQQEHAAQLASSQSVQNADIQRNLWETSLREGKSREVSGMKAAGLNPALAQDSGTVNGISSAPGTPVGANPVNVQNPIDAINSTKIADAQVRLLNSQASDQEFRNGSIYRALVLNGMDQSIALDVAREAAQYSSVSVNDQSIAESISRQDKILSDIEVNDATIQKLSVDNVHTVCKIAEIFQGIKESDQRIVAMRAKADCDRALAGLYKAAKSGQEITNEMLKQEKDNFERTMKARESVVVPVHDADGKPTGHYRSYWGNQAAQEATAVQIANETTAYNLRVLESLSPKERQQYLMNLDLGHVAIDGLNAVSNATSAITPKPRPGGITINNNRR